MLHRVDELERAKLEGKVTLDGCVGIFVRGLGSSLGKVVGFDFMDVFILGSCIWANLGTNNGVGRTSVGVSPGICRVTGSGYKGGDSGSALFNNAIMG